MLRARATGGKPLWLYRAQARSRAGAGVHARVCVCGCVHACVARTVCVGACNTLGLRACRFMRACVRAGLCVRACVRACWFAPGRWEGCDLLIREQPRVGLQVSSGKAVLGTTTAVLCERIPPTGSAAAPSRSGPRGSTAGRSAHPTAVLRSSGDARCGAERHVRS